MADDPRMRLAHFVAARRKELHLDQTDLRSRGGPSHATVGLIERGQAPEMQRGTKAGLEAALEWVAGSVDAILAGGSPLATPESVAESVGSATQDGGVLLSVPPGAFDGFSEADREEAIAAAKATLLERAREIRRRVDQ